jgi:uridine kinase
MIEENKFRPFLIGIVDGSLENQITKQLLSKLEGYQICSIYMSNYLIDGAENESVPELIDFELLEDHLLKLLNNEECSIPIYDFKNKKRSNETKKIESCQIIILDGLLCFHDSSIRNFLDLKIFIDTDNDTRYAETICKEIEKNNNLIEISQNYFDKIKPSHNNFIITKKFADLVLPNETGHQTAIDLIMNYLKLLLDRVNNNQKGNIFFFINEIIDAKYKFCEDNLILKKEKTTIDFLRAIFEDFIKQREDEEFVGVIRKTLIEMLESLLVDYLQKFTEIKLVFDSDDISNYDFKHCPTVFYFKTAILTQEDIEKPQYILSQNKNCNIIICSIFLAPRFAHLIIGKQINSILFATLYFSEFFVKYEKIIKGDKLVFNEKELEKIVKQMLSEYI